MNSTRYWSPPPRNREGGSGNGSPKSGSPLNDQSQATRLGGLLEGVIEDLGLSGKMAECRAKMAWEEAVGAPLALQTRPVRIYKGRLEVAVPSSVWRAQLSFMKRDIVDRINKLVGEEVVKELILLNRR